MASSAEAAAKLNHPSPAKNHVPGWYKAATRFMGGTMKVTDYGTINKDIKLCIPFLDAMTSGYVVELPADLLVERTRDGVSFYWHETPQIIEFRDKNMATTLPRPSGHDQDLYAWLMHWATILPSGYSALFVHPLNRFDLPFTTTNGIVDADGYSTGGQVPFFLRKDFAGIIPAGTPIIQIIPFKRHDWKSELLDYDDDVIKRNLYAVTRFIVGGYAKLFWNKKRYE